MPDASLIAPLLTAVAAAGREILEVARATVEVREKGDRSPVTEADERAERIILGALESLTPDLALVAEERVAADGLPTQVGGTFWLVDPIDGTREFLKGGTDFTVNVALVEQGVPVFGIVFCPSEGRLYLGVRGDGARQARLMPDGEMADVQRISTCRAATPLRVVASKSHSNPETDAYLANYPGAERVSIGSSLKFCLVAAGAADLYPRLGPTMEWDTAAGHAVLLAAGGRMADAAGADFRYGKSGFANGHFLAWGDPDFVPVPLPRVADKAG